MFYTTAAFMLQKAAYNSFFLIFQPENLKTENAIKMVSVLEACYCSHEPALF